ncbi:MAG: orotidine-5'-phosphate decarboxylase [Deltaproteobacteria bacterium]|nr:MAG: orotidine-5'-phosphate decarboxylase [Deltaproteobacteria bacterium]
MPEASRAPACGKDRIIVALDVPTADEALACAARLDGHVGLVKVGLELFVSEGPSVVRALAERHPDLEIFLDLKLHDIPNTMRGAVRAARGLGVRFLTVHAGAGTDHLRACVEEAGGALGILAVTVLTSQDARACAEAGATRTIEELVTMRARCAAAAGCAGVVCSGKELAVVRAAAPGLATVVPGIRPAGANVDDQKRVMTPGRAVRNGADYLVVGRPIRNAPDPAAAADAIAAEIDAALAGG